MTTLSASAIKDTLVSAIENCDDEGVDFLLRSPAIGEAMRTRLEKYRGGARVALSKARYDGFEDDRDVDYLGELHGILGQEGFGGLGDSEPRGVPMHGRVQSSGRGATRMAAESDSVPGDGSTNASHRFGRLLSELQRILDEEPEAEEANQSVWPVEQDVTLDDVLAGRAVQHGDVGDVLDYVGGRGKALPMSPIAKARAIVNYRIAKASAAGELSLPEELAAESLASMLQAANSDQSLYNEFMRRLNASGPVVQRLFGV